MASKHSPSSWAHDAATRRLARGEQRRPVANHRGTSPKPTRQTTKQASAAIAKELAANSRRNDQ